MDRPASALSVSNYQGHSNSSTGSFDIPSGGVGNIASFFERPSSALSNASNTTTNSTSDLKRIVQMEDVVLNGLGRKLEVLVKRHLSLSAINGLVKHCPQLKKLRLIDPMDCLPSIPKFENLQTIDITTSRKSHIKQFSHIFNSRTFTRLEHIKVEYEPPNNRPIQRLDQLLFHFSISAILSHCPRLKSLIHPIYPSTQDEFLNLLKTMRSVPDLKALSLRNYVNDRLLTTVSQKFPSLEALDISNTSFVSGYGIVDVVVNCVKLRYFGIHGIPICADDIQEIQRRLPRCHIFSKFDPKWVWSESMYYLCDTVIYKDDEWKKNDNYEEELLDEETNENEEVENPSDASSSCQVTEVSESVQDDDIQSVAVSESVPESIPESVPESVQESIPESEPESVQESVQESIPESESEPVQEYEPEEVLESIEEESLSNATTPTIPAIIIDETTSQEGITLNDEDHEVEHHSPTTDEDDDIIEGTPTLNHEVITKSQAREDQLAQEQESDQEEIKKPSMVDEFLEDNDELTIRANNSMNKSVNEDHEVQNEDEDDSIDEDYINDEYSQSQTFYEHQEEIIQDSSANSSINLINFDDDEEDQINKNEQNEDLLIKEDIKGLLENTIFMEDEKPSILDQPEQKDKKTISEGENLTFQDSHYSLEE